MKIRLDFVTNSSSSSFICIKLRSRDLEQKVLAENNMSYQTIEDLYEDEYMDEISLKGNLTATIGEGGDVHYIGYDLDGKTLENQTLSQIKNNMINEFNKVYVMKLNLSDLEFDYGEISRG